MMNRSGWFAVTAIVLAATFCCGFVFFYTRSQQARAQQEEQLHSPETSRSAIGKPLPEAHLMDADGAELSDEILRKGKVVLVFVTAECNACHKESEFLETVVGRRNDVSFYGVIPFGNKEIALETAKKVFPFKVLYDEGFRLAPALGVYKVPIKVFLQDGIIKKAWGGATLKEEDKNSFAGWLNTIE